MFPRASHADLTLLVKFESMKGSSLKLTTTNSSWALLAFANSHKATIAEFRSTRMEAELSRTSAMDAGASSTGSRPGSGGSFCGSCGGAASRKLVRNKPRRGRSLEHRGSIAGSFLHQDKGST